MWPMLVAMLVTSYLPLVMEAFGWSHVVLVVPVVMLLGIPLLQIHLGKRRPRRVGVGAVSVPPFVWAVLTEVHLCHACSFQVL
jgi:ATP/ADP translocase